MGVTSAPQNIVMDGLDPATSAVSGDRRLAAETAAGWRSGGGDDDKGKAGR